MSAPRRVAVLAAITLVVGVLAAAVADFYLFVYDDSCPQWEDEGPMAAPGSPYSAIMCSPGAGPPFAGVLLVGAAVTAALLVWVVWRRSTTVTRALPWLLLGLLLPTLLVGLLHLTLPRDCLSGETRSGDCSRDREQR